MNFDQLAGLIKAGFNEEQIRNISSIMDTGTSTNTGTNTPTHTPTGTALPTPAVTPGGTLPSAAQSAPITPSAPNSVTPTAPNAPSTPAASPRDSGDTGATANGTGEAARTAESETVTLLKEMLGLIQKGNINSVGTGAVQEQTGADVLAEILNPTPKAK